MGYFMAPERYWHWQGGNARPGEGGEPATYDIPLLVSNDGWNFSYLGDRQPIARPTLDSGIGNSRLWFTAPIASGDEELIYLTRGQRSTCVADQHSTNLSQPTGTCMRSNLICTRVPVIAGNMNEDGEVAPSTDGSKLAYKSEIALARIRIDGLYSLDSPYGHTANATTVPLLFNKGSEISLNVDASAGGSVTVAVMSPDGKRLLLGPSMPYTHSSIRARVQWPVNAGHPAGATVSAWNPCSSSNFAWTYLLYLLFESECVCFCLLTGAGGACRAASGAAFRDGRGQAILLPHPWLRVSCDLAVMRVHECMDAVENRFIHNKLPQQTCFQKIRF